MNFKDMEKRLAKGENPLELAIEKWQDIVNGVGKCEGADNCALCYVYGNLTNSVCEKCPVSKAGHPACSNTPYEDYENTCDRVSRAKYAKEEVAFLISLRPNELGEKTEKSCHICGNSGITLKHGDPCPVCKGKKLGEKTQ